MENTAEDIGLFLKAQRESLGYSLEDAAKHTRIRKTYLESIEKNQFADLPGQVYVTGFVRVYSRYLGLDSDALLSQLEEIQTYDVCSSLEPGAVTKLQPKRSKSTAAGEGRSAFVLGFLAVLVIGGVIYFMPAQLETTDSDEVTSNKPVTETAQPATETAQPVAETTQPVTETTQPVTETTQPVTETTQPVTETTQPVTETTQAAQRQTERAMVANETNQNVVEPSQKTERPSETTQEKLPEQKSLPSIPKEGSSLRILALAEGSLIIYVDDRKPHQYKLHNGLDLTWKVKRKVRVDLSGPGVARFWLGGQELNLGETESFQLKQAPGDF
jgi:cytoskeletal protein RodZ